MPQNIVVIGYAQNCLHLYYISVQLWGISEEGVCIRQRIPWPPYAHGVVVSDYNFLAMNMSVVKYIHNKYSLS